MLFSEKKNTEIKNIVRLSEVKLMREWDMKTRNDNLVGYKDDYDQVPFLNELPDYWPVVLIWFDVFFLTQWLLKWLTSWT